MNHKFACCLTVSVIFTMFSAELTSGDEIPKTESRQQMIVKTTIHNLTFKRTLTVESKGYALVQEKRFMIFACPCSMSIADTENPNAVAKLTQEDGNMFVNFRIGEAYKVSAILPGGKTETVLFGRENGSDS